MRRLAKNKYILVLLILLTLLFSYLMGSDLLALIGETKEIPMYARSMAFKAPFETQAIITSIINGVGLIVPFVAYVGMMNFFNEFDGSIIYYIGREDYHKKIKKSIFFNAIINALIFVSIYLSTILVPSLIVTGKITFDKINGFYNLGIDTTIYNHSPILYYIFTTLIVIAPVIFVYCIFTAAVYIITKSRKKVLMVNIFYYIILSVGVFFPNGLFFINPMYTIGSSTFGMIPVYYIFTPLIIPIIVAITIIYRKESYEL